MNGLTLKLGLVDVCLGPGQKFNIFSPSFRSSETVIALVLFAYFCSALSHKTAKQAKREKKPSKRINVVDRMLLEWGD